MEGGSADLPEEARRALESAGLIYVSDEMPGITRRRKGRGFAYVDAGGKVIRAREERDRCRRLAIPPAYEQVWICPLPHGHLQATGRDARGRKQYRYHENYRSLREEAKYAHILAFAEHLPALRARVDADLRRRGLPREKVIATVVHLLERTLIRVGNGHYARANGSYGLSTLQSRHVDIDGSRLRFRFRGKSGKKWNLRLADRRIARIVRSCHELPGQDLFQYMDEEGETRPVTSGDVNAYLREATSADISAKDFRTWGGTLLAATALARLPYEDAITRRRAHIRDVVRQVSATLGNTPAICRACYIHPAIPDAYERGELRLDLREGEEGEAAEQAVLDCLKALCG